MNKIETRKVASKIKSKMQYYMITIKLQDEKEGLRLLNDFYGQQGEMLKIQILY